MTLSTRPHPAPIAPLESAAHRCREVAGVGRSGGADREPIDWDSCRAVVLRCPGPLVALRSLAALYRVSAQRLAALLPACETHAGTRREGVAGALEDAVSDALGLPLTPTAVHYFHATWLRDPQLALKHGVRASPSTPDAICQQLEAVASGSTTPANRASLQLVRDGSHDLRRNADGLARGPRGCLVRDVLLRPVLYDVHDHLKVPALVQALAAACEPDLAFDLAGRYSRATTPCIVEYRRRAAHDREDVDAALWFVAAALRGAVSPRARRGHDAHGTPIAAHDIVGVRAIATQWEWTPEHAPC